MPSQVGGQQMIEVPRVLCCQSVHSEQLSEVQLCRFCGKHLIWVRDVRSIDRIWRSVYGAGVLLLVTWMWWNVAGLWSADLLSMAFDNLVLRPHSKFRLTDTASCSTPKDLPAIKLVDRMGLGIRERWKCFTWWIKNQPAINGQTVKVVFSASCWQNPRIIFFFLISQPIIGDREVSKLCTYEKLLERLKGCCFVRRVRPSLPTGRCSIQCCVSPSFYKPRSCCRNKEVCHLIQMDSCLSSRFGHLACLQHSFWEQDSRISVVCVFFMMYCVRTRGSCCWRSAIFAFLSPSGMVIFQLLWRKFWIQTWFCICQQCLCSFHIGFEYTTEIHDQRKMLVLPTQLLCWVLSTSD